MSGSSAFEQTPIFVYTSGKNGDGTFGGVVAILDAYETLSFQRGFYKPGAFSLTINKNTPNASALAHGRMIRVGTDNTKMGIVRTVVTSLTESGAYILTVSGNELWSLLEYRQIVPDAGQVSFTSAGSVPVETGLKTMIGKQCGASAAASRQFPSFSVVATSGRGPNMEMAERYTNLLDAVTRYLTSAACGLFATFTGTGWSLDFKTGTDRSASIIFSSDRDTLQSADYTRSDVSYRNVAIVGGQGDGAARMVNTVYQSTEPTGIDRLEMFVDARDLSLSGSLDNRGIQKLEENRFTRFIEFDALTYSRYVYGVNYDVGDIVTVQEFGISQSSRIISATEEWKNGSYEIKLVFDKELATITGQVSKIAETTVRQNAIF